MTSASLANPHRKINRMAAPPIARSLKSLLWAVLVTTVAIVWVAKGAWAERVSHRQLTLERELKELVIEANNIKQQLLQLSEFARVETEARSRLGMEFPANPPDKIWTETPVEQPLLGTMAFFSLIQREAPSFRQH